MGLPRYDSVGNPDLDHEHEQLLALCKKLEACLGNDLPGWKSEFHVLLNDLWLQTIKHFATEESLLQDCGYPLLNEHRAEHQRHLEALTNFLYDLTCGEIDRTRLRDYLIQWAHSHLLGSDMKFRGFLVHAAQHAA